MKKNKYWAEFTKPDRYHGVLIDNFRATAEGLRVLTVDNELYVCALDTRPRALFKPDSQNCIQYKQKTWMVHSNGSEHQVTPVR